MQKFLYHFIYIFSYICILFINIVTSLLAFQMKRKKKYLLGNFNK